MKSIFGAAVIAAAAGIAPASASMIVHTFDLTIDDCTGGCGTSPFGTVTVSQTDAQALINTLSIDVTLSAGDKFVSTGAGASLLFDILDNPTVTISNLSSGFGPGQTAPGGSIHAGATGYWEYSIICTACGHGGSNPQPGPLDFDIATGSALTPDDIIMNGSGLFFASDILGTTGHTGMVAADTDPSTDPTVPEPASLVTFASMLFGMGALSRGRKRRAAN